MAVSPPVVMPDEKMVRTPSGNCFSMSGISSTPIPNAKLAAITSTALRSSFSLATIRTPAAATVPNISSVAPPNTGEGMSENTMPTMGKRPKTTNMAAMK